jgi:hypothetical protein
MKSPYSELPRTGSFILSSIDPSVASRGTPQGARPRHLCFQGSLPGSIVRTCSWRSHLCRNWLRQPRRPRGGTLLPPCPDLPPALVFGLRRAAVSWAPKGPEPSEGRLLVHFDFSPHQMISSSNLTHRRAEHDERTQDVAHHHRHARPPSSRKGRRLPSGYLAPPGCGCVILDAFIIVARSEHTRCFRHPGWLKRADDSFHFAEQPMPIRHSQS